MRRGRRLVALAAALAMAYVAVTGLQVWWASRTDQRGPAQAIVVLGAAQYDGRPSPVFQARLDHALALYEAGAAPWVAVTGGGRPGDRSSEAQAAALYLQQRGVPDDRILWETDASSTWESLAATARILRNRALEHVVLVSDPSHALRIRTIAEDMGLRVEVSPTRTSPLGGVAAARQGARETLAVAAGRVLGHRRLTRLGEALEGGAAGRSGRS